MAWKRVLVAVCVVGMMGALLRAQANKAEPSGAAMAAAAKVFVAALTPAQASQARFNYDDAERLNWHFIPRPRKGLPLKALEGEPLQKAQALIQTGLSKAGYDQALNVMSLEEVLYLLEPGDRQERRERRDPQKYYLSIFGEPTPTGTWGWRLEGHHLSLNYTIVKGEVVASTPEFFGANPGMIDAGPKRMIRVLAPEEDLARQLLKLCSPEQLKAAWIDPTAPGEVRSAGAAQPETTPPVGLKAAQMTGDQKQLLKELLNEYLKNMPADVESARRGELDKAGFDNIYFAWWGKQDRNEPHHYRVQGPTFLIEYNNTQNDANHVHSMWRNLAGDFNVPLK
jgi:hypothetical protein